MPKCFPKVLYNGRKVCNRADLHTNRFTTDGRACRVTKNDWELIALLYGSPLKFSLSQKVRNWLRKVKLFHGAVVFQGAIEYCMWATINQHLGKCNNERSSHIQSGHLWVAVVVQSQTIETHLFCGCEYSYLGHDRNNSRGSEMLENIYLECIEEIGMSWSS